MTVQQKKVIQTDKAPAAIGPYSQAIRLGNLLFCSGQVPLIPTTGDILKGSIEEEAKQVLNNLKAVVEAAGSNLDQVVKTTIFLKDLGDFAKVNEVYASYFKAPFPARSTIQVSALPKGANIEIEAIAQVF